MASKKIKELDLPIKVDEVTLAELLEIVGIIKALVATAKAVFLRVKKVFGF